jgi:hypothetical protein
MSKKSGAPTKYKTEYCQLLEDHMANGLSFHSFAGVVGVCCDTLYEWVKVHPEFSDTMKRGKAKLLLWDEKLLSKGAQGSQRGYNVNAHKWKMANIHKWSDRTEVTNKNPANLSREELIREIESELAKLKESSNES